MTGKHANDTLTGKNARRRKRRNGKGSQSEREKHCVELLLISEQTLTLKDDKDNRVGSKSEGPVSQRERVCAPSGGR